MEPDDERKSRSGALRDAARGMRRLADYLDDLAAIAERPHLSNEARDDVRRAASLAIDRARVVAINVGSLP